MGDVKEITVVIDMDRLGCIAEDMIEIINSKRYVEVSLTINEKEFRITPIAQEIKIVLKR